MVSTALKATETLGGCIIRPNEYDVDGYRRRGVTLGRPVNVRVTAISC